MPIRPRRNRKNAFIRDLVAETDLSASRLILPVFVHESHDNVPIPSLPGCTMWSIPGLVEEVGRLLELGITSIDLFPCVPEDRKTPSAEEAFNPDGIIPRTIIALKEIYPELIVHADVALDPYNSEGHDGIVQHYSDGTFEILNDPTVEVLCQQALCFAEAGADVLSPSDMMDGRIAAIRSALDAERMENVSLMSYTAKYASVMYGPFRGALESAPGLGDKKTYQMDPRNLREAIREATLDEAEGADILMVKPATMYLDVVYAMRQCTTLPIAAYHVSGEYLMLKAAAASGWIDEQSAVLETLTSIRRAGADMILTYYAAQAAQWLQENC